MLVPHTSIMTVLARISEPRRQTFFIREFISTDVCERRKSNGSEFFAILSHDFEQIFGQILSVRVKALSNTLWYRQGIQKEKKAHFRLTCVTRKRRCLNSLIRSITTKLEITCIS